MHSAGLFWESAFSAAVRSKVGVVVVVSGEVLVDGIGGRGEFGVASKGSFQVVSPAELYQ